MPSDEQAFSDIEATLKKSAAALRDAQVPFLLGGSLASWARGGPESRHDLDYMIKEDDVERALEALEGVGMKAERPPEDWLVKAWDGEVLVDLIHHPKGMPVTDEVIARGEVISILSMDMRVMALEDVVVTKLNSLSEHHLRYETLLSISRALREKIDWDDVRRRMEDTPFARAFFVMVEGLGIVEPPGPATEAGDGHRGTKVRVLTEARTHDAGRFEGSQSAGAG